MSWIGDHAIKLEEWAKALLGNADEKIHTVGEDIARTVAELKGGVPALAGEAKADAEAVVKTAETQGVEPAVAEAVADAGHLAAEAVADVEQAVQAAHTPQQTVAVIAGEASVATEPTA